MVIQKLSHRLSFFYEAAPEYETLHKIFGELESDDCVLVVGTSGRVVNISSLIRFMEGFGITIGCKILNNLEESERIDATLFDKVFYKSATKAVAEIDRVLKEFWNL